MVNPEVTDPLDKIKFNKDGVIESTDERFKYTIDKCKIDRNYLNDGRRKLLEDFKKDIIYIVVMNKDILIQGIQISTILDKFVRDSKDQESQYLAFRRFAISKGWLGELIKEAIC